MARYIIILMLPLLLLSCKRENPHHAAQLDKAEQCIEQYPDSALLILNTLNLNILTTHKEKARYALLKSMALDKNYIDVTQDTLTSIALSYYKNHGTPDERLKAYYYNGRVCGNRKDYENEMDNYLKAEKFAGKCKDYVSVGRLYNAKMMVYKSILSIEMAVAPAKLSAHYYLKAKDTVRYITGMNNLAATYLSLDKYDSVKICRNKMQELEDYMTFRQKSNYYVNELNVKFALSDTTINETVERYLTSLEQRKDLIKWEFIASAYVKMGDGYKALEALDYFKKYNKGRENRSTFYYDAAEAYSIVGDYKSAYENLRKYHSSSSKKYYKILKSDTKFLEERYQKIAQVWKQRFYLIICGFSILLFIVAVYQITSYYKRISKRLEDERLQLVDQYEKAIAEKKKLSSIISKKSLDNSLRKVVEERMEILNKFIVSNISGIDMQKSKDGLNEFLKNNEYFLQSTKLSFELTHPKFISYLSKKGLTDWEIGCCCLYCMGLNGSEISNYLNIKYFYKNSSAIRKKLGVESMNIDTFLVQKFKEL